MDPWLLAGAFCAGLLDAIAGGGGLIQIPLLFGALPGVSAGTVFGTNKLVGVFGTATAAFRLARSVPIPWRLVGPAAAVACVLSYVGASIVAWIPSDVVRPIVVVLLIAVCIHTFRSRRPDRTGPTGSAQMKPWVGAAVGGGLGFYDGFFGPGTGSFLIYAFVRVFRLDFLQAAAAAKVVNVGTNLSALLYFTTHGHVLWALGFGMVAFNVVGAWVGSGIALSRGAPFVRKVFMLVVVALIVKLSWEIWDGS